MHHSHALYSDYPTGSSETGYTTTKSYISHQGGRGVSHWGDEGQSELGAHTVQSPPQPLSPTRIYPQGTNVSDLSAMLPSSLRSSHRPTLTPSRPVDQQRLVLTSLGPLPRRRPVSTSSHLSPPRHPDPSIIARISSSSGTSRQSPSVHQQSNQYLGWTHPETASDQRLLSRELAALPSPRQHDVRVSRPTSSIPPMPGQPLGNGGLDQRLTTITPADSKLKPDGTFHVRPSLRLTRSFVCRIPLHCFQNQTEQMVPWRVTIHSACIPADPGTEVGIRTRTHKGQIENLVRRFPGNTHWNILQLVRAYGHVKSDIINITSGNSFTPIRLAMMRHSRSGKPSTKRMLLTKSAC